MTPTMLGSVASFRGYVLTSLALATAVMSHAMYAKRFFYRAVVYMSSSKVAILATGNMCLVSLLLLWRTVQIVFLGQLRFREVERLHLRARDAILECCFTMTIFRDEFNASFLALVAVLLLMKSLHWLVKDRVEFLEEQPLTPAVTHARLIGLIVLLFGVDSWIVFDYARQTFFARGRTMLVLFVFEFTVLLIELSSSLVRYIFHGIDLYHEGGWEAKSLYSFYNELLADMCQLVVYILFCLYVQLFYTFPLHILRDLYLTFTKFQKRFVDFLRYRRVMATMNDRFEDVGEEELSQGDRICIICREEMQTAKRLSCGHMFHTRCLQSWLKRQMSCPTCRAPIDVDDGPASESPAAEGGDAERNGAAQQNPDAAGNNAAAVDPAIQNLPPWAADQIAAEFGMNGGRAEGQAAAQVQQAAPQAEPQPNNMPMQAQAAAVPGAGPPNPAQSWLSTLLHFAGGSGQRQGQVNQAPVYPAAQGQLYPHYAAYYAGQYMYGRPVPGMYNYPQAYPAAPHNGMPQPGMNPPEGQQQPTSSGASSSAPSASPPSTETNAEASATGFGDASAQSDNAGPSSGVAPREGSTSSGGATQSAASATTQEAPSSSTTQRTVPSPSNAVAVESEDDRRSATLALLMSMQYQMNYLSQDALRLHSEIENLRSAADQAIHTIMHPASLGATNVGEPGHDSLRNNRTASITNSYSTTVGAKPQETPATPQPGASTALSSEAGPSREEGESESASGPEPSEADILRQRRLAYMTRRQADNSSTKDGAENQS